LALGRLLVTDSTLWLLDEPFTSLDKAGVGVFETLMHDHVAAGGMIVMTTHHKVRVENARRLDLSA
jgi:heme exporter protein A